MKKILFTILILILIIQAFATTYYVSPTGNDANNGTGSTNSRAWKTIDKVNSFTFSAGDAILFKRGGEWYGTITIGQSGSSGLNILIGAYGSGAKPKIYGSEVITGWTLHSGNIYRAYVSDIVTQLFDEDIKMRAARYPNEGIFNVTTKVDATNFTSTEIASQAADYYKDANIIINTNKWKYETRLITASTGQTITFNSALGYSTWAAGADFFMTNKYEFLDEAGEWFYDAAKDSVYFWALDGESPVNVRGSVIDNGIVIASKNYIAIKNISLLHFKSTGIEAYTGNSNITIENCEIYGCEEYGIRSAGNYNQINYNTVDNTQFVGIAANSLNGKIKGNTISNIANFYDLGINGMINGYCYGLSFSGNNHLVSHNIIRNTAYNGINFSGQNSIIEKNYIYGTGSLLPDGGGIYTFVSSSSALQTDSGTVIRDNIIENSTDIGIYLDEGTTNVSVLNNTVVSPNDIAIFLHFTKDCIVRGNSIFDSPKSMRIAEKYDGNLFNFNTVCNKSTTQDYYLTTPINPTLANGSSSFINTFSADSNIYIDRHRTDVFRDVGAGGVYLDFTEWKTEFGFDTNSSNIITALYPNETEDIFFNKNTTPLTYYLNNATAKNNVTGDTIIGNFTLQPFTSIILNGKLYGITPYPDAIPPTMIAFVIPDTITTLTVAISTFTASTDARQYIVTESATTPETTDANWSSTVPTSYTFSGEGQNVLFAYCRDLAGNISEYLSDTVQVNYSGLSVKAMAWYDLKETEGSTLVDETATYNGSIGAEVTINQTQAFGASHLFNTLQNSYNTIGDNDNFTFSNENSFAFGFWSRHTNHAVRRFLLAKSVEYNVAIETDGAVSITIYSGGGSTVYKKRTSNTKLSTNTDYHIVVNVKDITTGNIEIWINGVKSALTSGDTGTFVSIGNTANPLVLGAVPTGFSVLGYLGQAIIFDASLTDAEIADLYNSGTRIYFDGL